MGTEWTDLRMRFGSVKRSEADVKGTAFPAQDGLELVSLELLHTCSRPII